MTWLQVELSEPDLLKLVELDDITELFPVVTFEVALITVECDTDDEFPEEEEAWLSEELEAEPGLEEPVEDLALPMVTQGMHQVKPGLFVSSYVK